MLKSILERVEIMLAAADISPILPPPVIDLYEDTDLSAAYAYRQPLPFFMEEESDLNAEAKSRANRLVNAFNATFKYR